MQRNIIIRVFLNPIQIMLYHYSVFMVLIVLSSCEKKDNNPPTPVVDDKVYFTNPIRNYGADPWIIFHNGYYYYSETSGNEKVYVIKSRTITGIGNERSVLVWQAPSAGTNGARYNIWGPHINFINNEWYIYFAAQSGPDDSFKHQRMWVLKSDSDNPLGAYTEIGEVLNSNDTEWAIDGSILVRQDGSYYFVWAGISDLQTLFQSTYIAKMINPSIIDRSTIIKISSPEKSWETSVRPIQEGQRPLYVDKNGKSIIMFSANASWTDEYCLGSLTNTDGNFLNPSSWIKSEFPLFQKTSAVFGPGGASYVKSPDGTEDWIVYHAAKYQGSGWDRNIRTQKFTWDTDSNPLFGNPIAEGVKQVVPAGE
jgi:GH43 family beta-xylosidase